MIKTKTLYQGESLDIGLKFRDQTTKEPIDMTDAEVDVAIAPKLGGQPFLTFRWSSSESATETDCYLKIEEDKGLVHLNGSLTEQMKGSYILDIRIVNNELIRIAKGGEFNVIPRH